MSAAEPSSPCATPFPFSPAYPFPLFPLPTLFPFFPCLPFFLKFLSPRVSGWRAFVKALHPAWLLGGAGVQLHPVTGPAAKGAGAQAQAQALHPRSRLYTPGPGATPQAQVLHPRPRRPRPRPRPYSRGTACPCGPCCCVSSAVPWDVPWDACQPRTTCPETLYSPNPFQPPPAVPAAV
jgi:hypothetical protein